MEIYSWLRLLFLIFHLRAFSCDKCIFEKALIKRNFYVGAFDLSFRIEVTKRTSHQIVSHIAKFLLQEALGYDHVYFVDQDTDNTTNTLQKMSTCPSPELCEDVDELGPEVMINLETWLSPGFNLERWIATKRIEDCGPLGPIGRAGWFMAKSTVEYFWTRNNTVVDHYRAFLNPEITKTFDLSSHPLVISKAKEGCNWTIDGAKYECGEDGFYRPPQCDQTQIPCATILSDFPGITYRILKEMIVSFELLVNIAWLGKDYETTLVKMITGSDQVTNVLFYSKKPMALDSERIITSVKFPGCEGDDDIKCEFEVNQLQKLVWSEIKINAPYAYDVLRAMTFSQKDYNYMLKQYARHEFRGWKPENIACMWLKENQVVWTKWVPEDAQKKTNLYIGGIFPGIYWKLNGVITAAQMAASAVNKNTSVLQDYELQILEQDGNCATDEVMRSFIEYVRGSYYKTMVGILGPACTDTVEPIAGVARHFNMVIISYSAEGTLFKGPEKNPFFFRTIPENNLLSPVYLKLLKKLDYTRVAALTENGQKYPEYLSDLEERMDRQKMEFIVNKKFSRERAYSNMTSHLQDLRSKGARIIIGDFYDYAARTTMCNAYKLGMTAANGYVWFLPYWFPSNWYDTDALNLSHSTDSFERVPCTTKEMLAAINGHFSLAYKFYGDDDSIMQENMSIIKWREEYRSSVEAKKGEESTYGGYAYDAVWVYALALDRLFKEEEYHISTLHTSRTSRRLIEIISEVNFNGVTGHILFQNSSRISDVMILQWINNSHRQVGVYKSQSLESGELQLEEADIIWLTQNGQKPTDGSGTSVDCDVEVFRAFLGTNCSGAKIIANVIGIALFAVMVLVVIVIYKRRYERRMKITEKRMKELGLLSSGVPFVLDEWELPRDHIVINRKLGEGAFGTVYGGEALVKNKEWIAVAVKTLKRNAKPEEKLDFLSEAEVMKQFDHINIVKLVGVCTTGEPVYTVMEFMLYGDLKTYLLARRNMAAEKDRHKNEEVSDRRLTNMALDIARGLSYLADKKFVHRDLACRNCLVNTSRSVKIADFGMCRAMFDSDYYRYNKKGMLPIRWMAPESLIDGLFTPMSDVWSYGVVLYEIITFASFPYQGFSHEQVLTHVKSHKTLPVPKGCKPELEALLNQCWASIPQARPQAAEIVEILAQNQELITPCLDVPAASVALEDQGTMEFKVHEKTRHSFSSVWQNRKPSSQEQPQMGIFDTSQILQAGLETVNAMKLTGLKHPIKKSLHESFKKVKRDLHRDKTLDMPPQVTYL